MQFNETAKRSLFTDAQKVAWNAPEWERHPYTRSLFHLFTGRGHVDGALSDPVKTRRVYDSFSKMAPAGEFVKDTINTQVFTYAFANAKC